MSPHAALPLASSALDAGSTHAWHQPLVLVPYAQQPESEGGKHLLHPSLALSGVALGPAGD